MDSVPPRGPVQRGLFGPYEIVRALGRGGMASVFEARHIDLHRRVALKVMHASAAGDDVAAQRFLREGRAACRIRHPHVVEVFDIGVEDDLPYLVMELLEGVDLRALLAKEGALPIGRALDLFLPVVSAVAAAHEAGVVHRDLTPANVFITRDSRGREHPKILDFGISKIERDGAAEGLTRTEGLLGTVHYMAPEQTRGARNADRRSDQYALGATLYEMISGRRPFTGESTYDVMHAVVTARLAPPSELRPEIPADLDRVVLRAMQRAPEDRYPSVRALGEALTPFATEEAREAWRALACGGPADEAIEAAGAAASPDAAEPPRAPDAQVTLNATSLTAPSRRPRGLGRALALGALVAVPAIALLAARFTIRRDGGEPPAGSLPSAAATSAAPRGQEPGESPSAAHIVARLRAFTIERDAMGVEFDPDRTPRTETIALASGPAAKLTANAERIVAADADPVEERALHLTRATFAAQAEGGFHLADRDSGVEIDVAPRDLGGAAELASGYIVYTNRDAPGAPVLAQRPHPEGVETFVLPEREGLSFTVKLGERAAAVRLVSGTLEVLDAGGAPRLRLAPPWIVDARHKGIPGSLAVSGCPLDTDPAPPWGRVLPAGDRGARTCDVRVGWGGDVAYPAMVALGWGATGSTAFSRRTQTVSPLPGGRILVAGGWKLGNPRSAEIFDPATRTWAATGSLRRAHYWHSSSALRDGRVLVLSGSAGKQAEIFDPRTGLFTEVAPLPELRFDATATLLADGRVLVVGGGKCHTCPLAADTATIYDPGKDTWTATGRLAGLRKRHTATLLTDGRVLVAGSQVIGEPQRSAEIYDPRTGKWQHGIPLSEPRYEHAAVTLQGGRVMLVGGAQHHEDQLKYVHTTDVFDPATGQFTPGEPLARYRFNPVGLALPDGRVVAIGGASRVTDGAFASSVEVRDPATGLWRPGPDTVLPREYREGLVIGPSAVLLTGSTPVEVLSLP